jgi:hypothetical protein
VIELIAELRGFARKALIVLDLERHPLAYHFLPMTRSLFAWSALTLHDGPVSVAAGFRPNELARLARGAGVIDVTVRRHWPWFRISAIVPARITDARREKPFATLKLTRLGEEIASLDAVVGKSRNARKNLNSAGTSTAAKTCSTVQ